MSTLRKAAFKGLIVGLIAAAAVGLTARSAGGATAAFFGCFVGMTIVSFGINRVMGEGSPLYQRAMQAAEDRQDRKKRR